MGVDSDGDGDGDGDGDRVGVDAIAPVDPHAPTVRGDRAERWFRRLVVVLSLVPMVVAAVMLVVEVGGSYMPATDHALTEMQIRDVGRHEVLVGLYSRDDWSHPGPAQFYVMAPFYWATGGASVSMSLAALAINGASVAGMLAIARRHGGTALMATVALGTALMLRASGAEFVHDPWNCYVTTLPFGLTVLLTWSMVCGWRWALPLGLGVAACIAQAHVGFVALALPLAAAGGVVLLARTWRGTPAGDGGVVDRAERTGLVAPVLVALGVQALLWAPVVADTVSNSPSNLGKIIRWFREGEGGTQSLGSGLSTVFGQLGLEAEWLGGKEMPTLGGESPFSASAPWPWLFVAAVVAAVALWRWRGDGRRLVVTLGVTLALSVAGVVRTVGPAFDYRLRWVWMVAVLVVAATAWAGVRAAGHRSATLGRAVLGAVGVALLVVSGVNVVTGATASTPYKGDSEALAALMPAVLDEVDGVDGQVLVTDAFATGTWYGRGIVLQLERQGWDARVRPDQGQLYGARRVLDGTAELTLLVATNEAVDTIGRQPGMRLVGEWSSMTAAQHADAVEEQAGFDEALAAGELTEMEHTAIVWDLHRRMAGHAEASYHRVAVFVQVP